MLERYISACQSNDMAAQAEMISVMIFLLKGDVVYRGLPWQKIWEATVEALMNPTPDMPKERYGRIGKILAEAGYEVAIEKQLPLPF